MPMKLAILKRHSKHDKGFSLLELLIAIAISLSIGGAAGTLLISQLRGSENAEAIEQQRNNLTKFAAPQRLFSVGLE